MKLFDIFSSSGDKIGEIHDDAGGGSCFADLIGILLIPILGIVIWVVLKDVDNPDPLYFQILFGVDIALSIYLFLSKKQIGFGESLSALIGATTLVVSLIYYSVYLDFVDFQIKEFIMVLFVTFLFSIVPAAMFSIVICILRKVFKKNII